MPENASARLVNALYEKAEIEFPSHDIASAILPTEWGAAPGLLNLLLSTHRPALVLHFGVAREAQGFFIETEGRNACRMMPDACGAVPGSHTLQPGGPDRHATTLPVERIVNRLRDLGLPAAASDDAGGYLCNCILYHSLASASQAEQANQTGFVHIPPDLSKPPLAFADALRGSLEILRLCLATAPDQRA